MQRVSRQSANDKGDNEVKSGAVHRSPGICLTAEENPEKTSARRRSDELCKTIYRLNWSPLPPNRSIGSHITSEREKRKKKKKRTGTEVRSRPTDLYHCTKQLMGIIITETYFTALSRNGYTEIYAVGKTG